MLSAFKQQHGAEYSLRALGYFGSYAHNTATPDSDADTVFETDNRISRRFAVIADPSDF
ncbi:nucleotidyltransferase domain-containing protein [Thiothrix subterranea]|uniref:Nucleotidyltransferase domain-containing protein n=1 Tax=Thiothrix subterranea TaxID=2735563 RepID=A0AA51QWN0_9GAMM|nr:nucleotidyltransferase domain-containing protein [Thiothrix subterranea]MDQ5770242.1 nucleotidyltransferase domain-containing protein [Thiothrix subterranea]WML86393.1 nucleotidyltransferase domain-containing protein [Thiothrix subterranea]